MARNWKNISAWVVCVGWLVTSVSFFSMLTGGGEAGMGLEIGPFLKLQDGAAVFFARGWIGFGILMLGMLAWKRRIGLILILVWSGWWGMALATALLSSATLSERGVIVFVVLMFIASGWFAVRKLKARRSVAGALP